MQKGADHDPIRRIDHRRVTVVDGDCGFRDSPAPPQISGTVQSPVILPGPIAPEITQQPLWTIGGLPVAIWAPVPPPYNMQVNRSAAADPFYDQPD